MQLTSSDIQADQTIAAKYVYAQCGGQNASPALAWIGAPAGTQSLALTVFDPDAPGKGWWHWVLFNLPSGTHHLATGASTTRGGLPAGSVQGKNDYGSPGYGGPCPPVGDQPHRYVFTIHALKVASLPFDASSSGWQIGPAIDDNTLAKASFAAFYGR